MGYKLHVMKMYCAASLRWSNSTQPVRNSAPQMKSLLAELVAPLQIHTAPLDDSGFFLARTMHMGSGMFLVSVVF